MKIPSQMHLVENDALQHTNCLTLCKTTLSDRNTT